MVVRTVNMMVIILLLLLQVALVRLLLPIRTLTTSY